MNRMDTDEDGLLSLGAAVRCGFMLGLHRMTWAIIASASPVRKPLQAILNPSLKPRLPSASEVLTGNHGRKPFVPFLAMIGAGKCVPSHHRVDREGDEGGEANGDAGLV
jgi:hypothetical protein